MHEGDWCVLKKGGSRRRSHFITLVNNLFVDVACGFALDKEDIEPDHGAPNCKRCVEMLEKGKG